MSAFIRPLQETALKLTQVSLGTWLNSFMASENPTGDPDYGRQAPPGSGKYKPTPMDVVVVRVMLEKVAHLPPEIIDIVLDHAEYWPHSTALFFQPSRNPVRVFRVNGGTEEENKLMVRCPPVGFYDYRKVGEAFKTAPLPPKSADGSAVAEPLQNLTLMEPPDAPATPAREAPREYFAGSMTQPPELMHPVRKIVFRFRSKDQGWGGDPQHQGTYHGSWTWFEAGLEKFDSERKCTLALEAKDVEMFLLTCTRRRVVQRHRAGPAIRRAVLRPRRGQLLHLRPPVRLPARHRLARRQDGIRPPAGRAREPQDTVQQDGAQAMGGTHGGLVVDGRHPPRVHRGRPPGRHRTRQGHGDG